MSLQLILGGSGSGKSSYLYKRIIEESQNSLSDNYLIIVPEQFTLQTQKDIVAMHPNKGIMNIDILSFLRFSFRIFDEVGGNNYPILEDTGKTMILRKVIARKKKELKLFGAGARKPGFINELKSMLSEIYQYSISIDELEEMRNLTGEGNELHKPVLNAKLNDIITIYQGFEEFIDEKYITAEEVLDMLFDIIDQSKWFRNSIICFDGFTGFTPSQNKILGKMMKLAKKTYITVTLDKEESIEATENEHKLFGLSLKTISKLQEVAKDNNIKVEELIYAEDINAEQGSRFANAPALGFLEKNIFRYPFGLYKEEQDNITIHGMKTTLKEVEFVAMEIKRLIEDQGYRYRDIAVITGDIGLYNPIISRIFAVENIPCFIDYKKEILHNPLAETLRAAVAITVDDFSYESVFRYLRAGLSSLENDEIDQLENYVLACGINGPQVYKARRRGIKAYSEEFTRKHPSFKKANLDQVNELRVKFYKEIEPLHKVLKEKDSTIADKTKALYEFGTRVKAEEKLNQYAERFEQDNMLAEAKEYEQIYGIVIELYDQMVLLLGDEKASPREFDEILEAGLSEAKIGIIPPGIDEVVVGDTERTRLKEIKALFFIGVNEGIIPKGAQDGGIFSNIEKEILLENDFVISPTKRQVAFIEQFYMYLNMTKPQERLYITFHKLKNDGKTIRPSYIITKIMQLYKYIKVFEDDINIGDTQFILRDSGLEYLAEGLRSYPLKPLTDEWKEIYRHYKLSDHKQIIVDNLIEGAFYKNEDKGLSKEVAESLYGKDLEGSVSRLEKFAACSYAHFLSYGLYLRERPEYKFDAPDMGNIFHSALDIFSKRLDKESADWISIDDDIRDQWAKESVDAAIEEYGNTFIKSTKRSEYLIERIKRITIWTLLTLSKHINQSNFTPKDYEKAFNYKKSDKLRLKGIIDRIDIYEEDGKIYVRIIDYKSGQASFDFNKIYYGIQRQLCVYMEASLDYLKGDNPEKEIIPGGLFYYKIDDPIVDKSPKWELDRYQELRMDGLINQEDAVVMSLDQAFKEQDQTEHDKINIKPSVKSSIVPVGTKKDGYFTAVSKVEKEENIMKLIKYVGDQLIKDSEKILGGDVSLNPYELKNMTPCDYCEFSTVCGFDSGLPGHKHRILKSRTADDIKAEIWGDNDEVDKTAKEDN